LYSEPAQEKRGGIPGTFFGISHILQGAAVLAKRLQRVPCNHENAIDSNECIRSVVGGRFNLFNVEISRFQ
jgi:hypothetical protein